MLPESRLPSASRRCRAAPAATPPTVIRDCPATLAPAHGCAPTRTHRYCSCAASRLSPPSVSISTFQFLSVYLTMAFAISSTSTRRPSTSETTSSSALLLIAMMRPIRGATAEAGGGEATPPEVVSPQVPFAPNCPPFGVPPGVWHVLYSLRGVSTPNELGTRITAPLPSPGAAATTRASSAQAGPRPHRTGHQRLDASAPGYRSGTGTFGAHHSSRDAHASPCSP